MRLPLGPRTLHTKTRISLSSPSLARKYLISKMSTQTGATRTGPSTSHQPPTTIEDWTRSDQYHNSFLITPDKTLADAREKSAEKGLPDIAVSAAQGKFLKLLAQSLGAKRILEVGTLGGYVSLILPSYNPNQHKRYLWMWFVVTIRYRYSTIWLARALPEGGDLVTCELKPEHAQVAQANVENAGLASKVKIIVGPAKETLANLQPSPPFDFVFVDADKPSLLPYYIESKRLVKKGGVIVSVIMSMLCCLGFS